MPDPLDESAFRFEITCDTPGNLSVVIKCELLVFDDIRDRANQQQATSKEVQKTDPTSPNAKRWRPGTPAIPIAAISKTV
jgi:hypothetical protein